LLKKKIRDEIVRLKKDGCTYEEVASQLKISVSSAKKYCKPKINEDLLSSPPARKNALQIQQARA